MAVAELVRGYFQVLIWPLFAIVVVLRYGRDVIRALETRQVKMSFLGVSVEVAEAERRLGETIGTNLTDRLWAFLEEIAKSGDVLRKDYEKRDVSTNWIRPARNAGLIKTVPENATIGSADKLELTPLGKLIVEERRVKH